MGPGYAAFGARTGANLLPGAVASLASIVLVDATEAAPIGLANLLFLVGIALRGVFRFSQAQLPQQQPVAR